MSTAKLVAQSRRRASGLSLRRGTAACSAVMATLLVGCLLVPWSSNSKASASAPAKSITLGNIYAISGPIASTFEGYGQGVEARLDLQNAEGGVNGFKLKVVNLDDQGSGTLQLNDAENLVENKHAFAILEDPVVNGAAQYLEEHGSPDYRFGPR